MGCHFLLQGIFLTQGLNPGLPHCRQTLYCLSHQGSWSEWPSSKSLQTINAGEGVEKRERSCTVGGNVNWQPLWKTVWRFLKKLGIKPHDPEIPLLGIYTLRKPKLKDTCIPLFTAALFTLFTTDEWIKKLWYLYTMEYYSAIKRNAFESVLMRWINLEPITQRDRKSVV